MHDKAIQLLGHARKSKKDFMHPKRSLLTPNPASVICEGMQTEKGQTYLSGANQKYPQQKHPKRPATIHGKGRGLSVCLERRKTPLSGISWVAGPPDEATQLNPFQHTERKEIP